MKRILSFLLIVLLACTATAALTSCSEMETIVLNVYNWGEYISDGSEDTLDVNAAFEAYYLETYGVKLEVNYTTYASNEDLYAKLKSGATGYDIIIPSDYMIQRMISEDMLETLNFNNIPNYQYISESCRGLFYDPQEKYSVPYTYGMIGVIYNAARVDEADVGGWDLLWNPKYSGQILQFNNSRDAFGSAMYYAGIDPNTTDMTEWQKALDLLVTQKVLVQSYVMDEVFNKMEGEEAAIAAYYAGDYLSMAENNENLAFYYPTDEEGNYVTNAFIDAMCIPKGCKNKEAAERYIDFMLSKEVAIANAEYVYYASPNRLVYEDADYIDYIGEEGMEILYPSHMNFKEMYSTYAYRNLSTEMLQEVNVLWEKLKIDSSTVGNGIYIACAVILVFLIAYAIFSYVQKLRHRRYYW
ncbi:MAG: spermidine/putrescine ABC transporter substrate-binding protein [Clostridia bacterium]|nr:spermidine/putrescine ABC transporter substrate-binding protein [Clostridia bacterium]